MDGQTHRQHEYSIPHKQFARQFFKVSTTYEPRHKISINVVFATSKGSDQPAHTRSLIRAFASRFNIL